MEEKKLKEIEAKLTKLLSQVDKKDDPKRPALNKFKGAKVIRRRKGQMDLHLT